MHAGELHSQSAIPAYHMAVGNCGIRTEAAVMPRVSFVLGYTANKLRADCVTETKTASLGNGVSNGATPVDSYAPSV